MGAYADLHLHTCYSDSSDSPMRVVERAAELGLAAIAITDHDTIEGIEEAERAAKKHHIEFLPGVEISARYGQVEVHVVGLGINPRHSALTAALDTFREERSRRIDAILERLNALGVSLERAEIEAIAGRRGTLGRVHVARALMVKGAVRRVQEAFDKYLRSGRKAYVPKKMPTCRETIDLIHDAGGIVILAHPGVGKTVAKLAPRLIDLGFDGIEVYHTKHTPGHVTQFTQLALEKDLLISGGSDCHGTALNGEPDMGKVRLPYQHLERIKNALAAARSLRLPPTNGSPAPKISGRSPRPNHSTDPR